MTPMTRRGFASLAAAGAASLGSRGSFADTPGVGFMSFTYAEDPNRPLVQKLMDDFKAQSGIPIQVISTAWGETQKNLILRLRSHTQPATVQVQERWVPSLAALPEIVDLDEVMGRQNLEAAIDPKVLTMGKFGGRTVGLPMITGSICMVANTEVLAKAGVGAIPTTLAEFRTALVAIRDKVPNSVPFASATKNPNSIPLDFMIMVWAHGGRIIDTAGHVVINSDAGKAALGFLTDLMKNRLIAPDLDRPDLRRLFAQGASGFFIDSPQARAFVRSFSGRGEAADAFTQPIPTPVLKAGDTPHSVQWGHLVMAFKGPATASPDAPGIKWLNYLISDAVQGSYPPSLSTLPVTKSAQFLPAVQNDPFFKAWITASGVPLVNEIGIWPNAPELSVILSEEVQGAILGQKSPDAAIVAMQSRMEASMAKRG